MPQIKRVLVPVDFSEYSREALRYAAFMAETLGASLTALHMHWDPPSYVGVEVLMTPIPNRDQTLQEFARTGAEKQLEEMVTSLDVPWADKVERIIEAGDAAQGILRHAEGFDMIIMGTHGRSGLDHWLMGSVAEKVVRRAPCPVLTIRYQPPKEKKE